MAVLFVVWAVAVFLSGQSCGIPIAKAMGCGKSPSLSIEKRIFCCEHFNLDCVAKAVNAVQVDDIGNGNGYEPVGNHINAKLVRIRTLGEDCNYPADQCAVGLRCKGGYCLRERSNAHLKALLDRGKLVEEEERGVSDSGTDEEPGDPLPAQKGLILEGQAVKNTDSFSSESSNLISSLRQDPRKTPTPCKPPNPLRPYTSTSQDVIVERQAVKNPTPRKTPTPLQPYTPNYQDIRVEGQAVKVDDSYSSQGGLRVPSSREGPSAVRRAVAENKGNKEGHSPNDDEYRPKPMMEEEDELAANIADLLAAKLGVSLDSEEMHNIRELIAGTLDERAEREDEVTQNIQNQVEENGKKNSEVLLTAPMTSSVPEETESNSNIEQHNTRYEPLVQCASDGTVSRAANEMSKTMKTLGEQAERFVHVAL